MKLVDFLRKECVVADAKLCNKAAALYEITRLAKKSQILGNVEEQEIIAGLQECELPEFLNLGRGIAILSAYLKSVNDSVIGIITVPSGVDFDAPNWKTINLIIFIIGSEGRSKEYNNVFSVSSIATILLYVSISILATSNSSGSFFEQRMATKIVETIKAIIIEFFFMSFSLGFVNKIYVFVILVFLQGLKLQIFS